MGKWFDSFRLYDYCKPRDTEFDCIYLKESSFQTQTKSSQILKNQIIPLHDNKQMSISI